MRQNSLALPVAQPTVCGDTDAVSRHRNALFERLPGAGGFAPVALGAALAATLFAAEARAQTVNGVCSAANGVLQLSTPTTLCNSGAASLLSGSGPWSWSCTGSGGGASVTCGASLTSMTLASLAPSLVSTMGYGNPAYVSAKMATSPVTAAAADVTEQFTAPDGRFVTATVKNPVVTKPPYTAPPITQGESPVTYFQKAIAAAGSGGKLVVPAATYNFPALDCSNTNDSAYASSHLLIQSVHDMVIDGQGSRLNFTSDCPGITFNAAARIIFKNFTIDWPNWQNAAVGTVTAVGGSSKAGYTYSLQVPAGSLPSGFKVATPWDAVHDYWSLTGSQNEIFYSTSQQFSAAGLATSVSSNGHMLAVGESMLVRNTSGVSNAVLDWNSQDITVQGVTIYNAPAMGFMIAVGRGLHLNQVQVTRANGRPISTTADAVHFGTFGGDIFIENSLFAYQGDDGLNINTETFPIPPLLTCGAASCQASLSADGLVAAGDTIALYNPAMKFVGTATASCATGSCTANISPIAAQGGFAADLTTANARYVIRNNTFYHNRARGALLQTPYGLVQANNFIAQSMFALYLVESSNWSEGPGAENVLLIDNYITSNGAGGGPGAVTVGAESPGGLVYVDGVTSSATPPIPGVHQNLIFAGNTVENTPGAAFYVSSANNVVLFGNTIANTNSTPSGATPCINRPVAVYDSSNVVLEGNTLNGGNLSGSVSFDDSDLNIQGK